MLPYRAVAWPSAGLALTLTLTLTLSLYPNPNPNPNSNLHHRSPSPVVHGGIHLRGRVLGDHARCAGQRRSAEDTRQRAAMHTVACSAQGTQRFARHTVLHTHRFYGSLSPRRPSGACRRSSSGRRRRCSSYGGGGCVSSSRTSPPSPSSPSRLAPLLVILDLTRLVATPAGFPLPPTTYHHTSTLGHIGNP